ncbi:MAG: hypothetical protein WC796_00100 [Candidatus Pacearchaeota archaeon]|jgi:hypothetical protein
MKHLRDITRILPNGEQWCFYCFGAGLGKLALGGLSGDYTFIDRGLIKTLSTLPLGLEVLGATPRRLIDYYKPENQDEAQ